MCSCHDCYALNAHELIGDRLLNLQAQFDGFLDPLHENVKRLGLRVAASQGGYRSDKIPVFVLLS